LSRAKSKSILTPSQSNVKMGTAAPSTGSKLVTLECRRMRSASQSGSRTTSAPSVSDGIVPKKFCHVTYNTCLVASWVDSFKETKLRRFQIRRENLCYKQGPDVSFLLILPRRKTTKRENGIVLLSIVTIVL
jgi:hypothetical protein